MPYSEADLERIDTDPVLRRQYFWQIGHRALLRSVEERRNDLRWAQINARFGRIILDNLDDWVNLTGKEAENASKTDKPSGEPSGGSLPREE